MRWSSHRRPSPGRRTERRLGWRSRRCALRASDSPLGSAPPLPTAGGHAPRRGHARSWEVASDRGRVWEVGGGRGRSEDVTEGHGRSWEIIGDRTSRAEAEASGAPAGMLRGEKAALPRLSSLGRRSRERSRSCSRCASVNGRQGRSDRL